MARLHFFYTRLKSRGDWVPWRAASLEENLLIKNRGESTWIHFTVVIAIHNNKRSILWHLKKAFCSRLHVSVESNDDRIH